MIVTARSRGSLGPVQEHLSLEEPRKLDPEIAQDIRERQPIVRSELPRRTVGVEDVSGTGLWIEHDHSRDANLQVFIDLREDVTPAVIPRANLDDEIRWEGKISFRNGPFRQPRVAVKGHVGPANGIGVAFGDDARIVADNVTKVVLVEKPAEQVDDLDTNLTVP